jgi:hypothetical protein
MREKKVKNQTRATQKKRKEKKERKHEERSIPFVEYASLFFVAFGLE